MDPLAESLVDGLGPMGFKAIAGIDHVTDCRLILTRRTFNSNRAVAYLFAAELPPSLPPYLKERRWEIAKRVGFVPFLWGLGLQIVLAVPRFTRQPRELSQCVASIDNQWCVIQSLFLIAEVEKTFTCRRSSGQFLTGKYQDKILEAVAREHQLLSE